MSFPARAGAGEPSLSVDPGGMVYASWFEPGSKGGNVIRVSRLDRGIWTPPRVAATGDSFFVNWADTPILLARGGGKLALSYPWRSGAGTYAYDVRIIQSADEGASWGRAVTPHRDGTPTEHGFVSMIPEPGGVRAVWLDGRKTAEATTTTADGHGHGAGPEMTLRTARLLPDGRIEDEPLLDERVCDCCQTAMVRGGAGVLVAYRDRDAGEIRDVSLVLAAAGRFGAPYPLHTDAWKMAACPVNGPALDAVAGRVAAAWYTGAGDRPAVWLARSDDGGRTFGSPLRVDDVADSAGPLGRLDVVTRSDGAALVSWVQAGREGASIRVREFPARGPAGAPRTLASTAAARASGFPRMVRSGDQVVFAWTEAGKPSAIRAATAIWKRSGR